MGTFGGVYLCEFFRIDFNMGFYGELYELSLSIL